jgi:hypothetical protein
LTTDLQDITCALLDDAGFIPDDYVFLVLGEQISVEFDDKGAAEYLLHVLSTSDHKDVVTGSYQTKGKRHCVTLFHW